PVFRLYTSIMSRKTNVDESLSVRELETRYRKARCPANRSHRQIVCLLAQGKPAREVAAVTGYSAKWVGEIARRYNNGGLAGLGDRRHQNARGRPLFNSEHM